MLLSLLGLDRQNCPTKYPAMQPGHTKNPNCEKKRDESIRILNNSKIYQKH